AAPATEAPPADPIEAAIQRSKTLIPGVWTWGADARLRHETFINSGKFSRQAPNNEEHFQRYRARWWTTITPVNDVEFYTRLTWEGRNYCRPLNPGSVGHRDWMDERDEVIIDNLYLKLSNIGGSPVTLQAGRFDVTLGDGWLVYEGGPLDGSRTYYFDGGRILLDLKDIKTTVDTYYLYTDAEGDAWFPKLKDNDIPPFMVEEDEHGVVVYVTNKSLPKTQIEPYFIYKNGQHEFVNGRRAGIDSDIYTFGTRVTGDVGDHWRYSVNLAGQFGHKGDQDQCALGSNNRLSYLFKDTWKNELYMDYEYLSGDKDSTRGRNEGFDILWGRYPRWDELYGFTFANETRTFDYTNMHRVSYGWKAMPTKKAEVGLRYDLLFADKKPFENTGIFGDGCFRGQMIVPYFKYTFNSHLFTRVMPFFFFPGDYYAKSNNDPSTFFRWEIHFTW
ncbi:MAG TPA: alginate export family protein, partial [Phycisphaerae bacterium]|nr:alginate export family protein [Phycisphaerae bacterium]